eukprot:1392674-Amorphochlora_amoeboformis.AAC.1
MSSTDMSPIVGGPPNRAIHAVHLLVRSENGRILLPHVGWRLLLLDAFCQPVRWPGCTWLWKHSLSSFVEVCAEVSWAGWVGLGGRGVLVLGEGWKGLGGPVGACGDRMGIQLEVGAAVDRRSYETKRG